MASPQRENGFTPIAHEIVERLAVTPLSGGELRVLLHLFRSTYGWNRKKVRISYGQWVAGTNMNRGHVIETLRRLVDRSIVIRSENGAGLPEWGLQKDHERWGGTPERTSTPQQTSPLERTPLVRQSVPEVVRSSGPHKRNKEKLLKKESRRTAPHPDHSRLMGAYQEALGYEIPNGGKEGKAAKWLLDHGHTVEEIIACYRDLKGDRFYEGKHLSLQVVREQIGAWRAKPTTPSLNDYEDAGVVLARQLEPAGADG